MLSGCGGDGESYLDMAFDDGTVLSNGTISETAWANFEKGDYKSAGELFVQALSNSSTPQEEAFAKEGLAWILRENSGIISAIEYFEFSAPFSISAKVGYACALISRGAAGDQNKALTELDSLGLTDPARDYKPVYKNTISASELHAMVALSYFLRDYPDDILRSDQHVSRTIELLKTDYSKSADDTVKALNMMKK
jgi:hypothetical protein